VMNGLDELWQRRIVREQGVVAYDFTHDKLRQVAYAGISPVRRRLVHGRIITALETLHADNLDKASAQLAAHYEAVQQWQKAIDCYQRAAHVSNRIFAHQETIQHLRRAIALLPHVDIVEKQQAKLYELLGDVLALTGGHEVAQEMFETAVFHAKGIIWQSQLYRKIADTWQVRLKFEGAFQAFQEAEAGLGQPEEAASLDWWQEWLWVQIDRLWVLFWSVQIDTLAELTVRIQPLIARYGLTIQRGLFSQGLVLLALWRDRFVITQGTIRDAQDAVFDITASGKLKQIAFARFVLGLAHLHCGWHGNLDEAETALQKALDEAVLIGDVVLQSRCLIYLTKVYRRKQDVEQVRAYVSRTIEVATQAHMENYIYFAQAHAAWIGWQERDFQFSLKNAQEAITYFQTVLRGPHLGEAIWPMIGVNMEQGDLGTAVNCAKLLLDPKEMRMPDCVMASLQQALVAWEHNQPNTTHAHLNHALQLAQTYHYL
ncbi:MAG: tetratricopeptide repeat protein, partial [Chloroflexi bacterium]|nr:tetratricopeptide repeat protein [Chloroflexota bacterium]